MNTNLARLRVAVPQPIARPSEGRLSMRAEHKTALQHVASEAAAIAGAAGRIVVTAQEALERGGDVSIQSQVQFLTGAYARLIKDLGVVEHLQKHGAARPKGRVK